MEDPATERTERTKSKMLKVVVVSFGLADARSSAHSEVAKIPRSPGFSRGSSVVISYHLVSSDLHLANDSKDWILSALWAGVLTLHWA